MVSWIYTIYLSIRILSRIPRASCYSARLSWSLVLTWVSPIVQDKGYTPGLDQVRVFNVHIQSKPVTGTGTGLRLFLCPGQENKKGGGSKGGPPALAGTREYEQSDPNR